MKENKPKAENCSRVDGAARAALWAHMRALSVFMETHPAYMPTVAELALHVAGQTAESHAVRLLALSHLLAASEPGRWANGALDPVLGETRAMLSGVPLNWNSEHVPRVWAACGYDSRAHRALRILAKVEGVEALDHGAAHRLKVLDVIGRAIDAIQVEQVKMEAPDHA